MDNQKWEANTLTESSGDLASKKRWRFFNNLQFQGSVTNGCPERDKPLMKVSHNLHVRDAIVSVYHKQASSDSWNPIQWNPAATTNLVSLTTTCKNCGKSYSSQYGLTRHLKIHKQRIQEAQTLQPSIAYTVVCVINLVSRSPASRVIAGLMTINVCQWWSYSLISRQPSYHIWM